MQIRTYKAFSMKDVLAKIKTEMGPNALILSTREVKDNSYGTLTKPMIEVTAAVDYDAQLPSQALPSLKPLEKHIPSIHTDSSDIHSITSGITELGSMMRRLLKHSGVEQPLNPTREALISQGIKASLVDMMISKLGENTQTGTIKGLLTKLIKTSTPTQSKIWAFFGSTGVGKTTTIAKIAANAALRENQSVGIISLDTYRIGAIEQGRTYSKILNIPFAAAGSVDEFRSALDQLHQKDIILVDTVGRSPLNSNIIDQLQNYFAGMSLCKFLLLPVAIREIEMERTTKTFSSLGIDRVIFTKLDEAMTHGSIITHNLLYRIPLTYITTGQRVPEDIEEADAAKIVALCFGDKS
ncbi:MAG: flagellar biosynthesis protein FlhF [Deltaproteobacteria bacterium]|nr:flagellar biosynthesis protein FlhF [Deltaproteobacteria bacterium]